MFLWVELGMGPGGDQRKVERSGRKRPTGSWEGMENEGKRSSLEPLEPGLIILQEMRKQRGP